MKTFNTLAVTCASLLILVDFAFAEGTMGHTQAQQSTDIERVNAASQAFVASIVARDIDAMDKVWAHVPHATFIGPLSTAVVTGWNDVKKAWAMRFSQFDRVTISLTESHIRTVGDVAWVVGMEKIELRRKTGDQLSLHAFVTNVFEKHDGRWLVVSHQATPVFMAAQ